MVIDGRTKATVKDGIVFDCWDCNRSDAVRYICYQPGNGTKYFLCIIDTECEKPEVNINIGFGNSSGYIIVDLNNGRSMTLGNCSSFIAANYVMEKLRCGISDAYVLAELFAYLFDREAEEAGPSYLLVR